MSELNQSSDTVKNQKENLSQNISFFIQDIFQDTSPFHQQLKHFYGEKESKIIRGLLIGRFITRSDYLGLKNSGREYFGEDFIETLDYPLLIESLGYSISHETLLEYIEECIILFHTYMTQYGVFDILKTEDCNVVAEGKGFKIIFSEGQELYYMLYNGKTYLEKDIIWQESNNNPVLETIIFEGDNTVFIYNFLLRSLDRYDYEINEIFERGEKTLVHMTKQNETYILCLEDKTALKGNFILKDHIAFGDEIFFVTEFKSSRYSHSIQILSQSSGEIVLEYQGSLMQIYEHASGVLISIMEEESIDSEKGIQTQYYINTLFITVEDGKLKEKRILKTLNKVQKYTLPEEKCIFPRMDIAFFSTQKMLYAQISFFPGETNRDMPLHNFIGINTGYELTSLTRIIDFTYTTDGIRFRAKDISGNDYSFDSQKHEQDTLLQSASGIPN